MMKNRMNKSSSDITSVAVIGNYPPRHCGIATFTSDLLQSLAEAADHCQYKAIALNDKQEGYNYPDEVRFEINQDKHEDYRTAARFLNMHQVDVISLQHEFGIFGGDSGDYILTLLRQAQMPVVTTLHTVLVEPTGKQEQVMMQLTELSDRFVVMSQSAVNILHTIYDIPKEKITYIPHGIPDMPFVDPNYYKEQFNLLGQKVLLTFGLLSQNKGIEYVIKSLPKALERFPDLTYIVLGATHPHVLAHEGEKYRRTLQHMVKDLHLEDHVTFKNKFVPFEELCDYLAATDVYVTPYTQEEQITSGTLAYASGTGKAVISTPYWYAQEMLSEGRGQLVPFKNADAISEAIIDLFENESMRHQMRKRAYDFNRNATWEEVARQYTRVFQQVKSHHHRHPYPPRVASSLLDRPLSNRIPLPPFKLDHLLTLSDDTGVLQHANHAIADRSHGYCTDDNARALIVAVQASQLSRTLPIGSSQLNSLADRYLAFLLHAFNPETGRFRNFMSYSRQWLESRGSEDAHGRALWALGVTVSLAKESTHLNIASTLFLRALDAAYSFQSPRAIAFSLIGIEAYLQTFPGDSKAKRMNSLLAERLFDQFKENAGDDWPWLENILAYSNGKVPQGLLQAGKTLHRADMITMALQALDWLIGIQTDDGHLSPIGNQQWYKRGGKKARFDQQPLEANALMEACVAAYNMSGNKPWLKRAKLCFNWFLGHNDLNIPLYNKKTGGCRDGLQADRVNQNEGAESTLAWLLSLTAMYELSEEKIVSSSAKSTSQMERN